MASPSHPAFWILSVLAAGRRHGWEILLEARAATEGQVSLKVPTLYAALDRLERQGLIRADGEVIVDGRARRYFVLTEYGTARLHAEVDLLETAARAARRHLAGHRSALPRETARESD